MPPGRLELAALQGAHVASLVPTLVDFHRAATDPGERQLALLKQQLEARRGTAYGDAVGLERVNDVRSFQSRVPIVDYEELEPWILRAARGESFVLTREPVALFERSSGSTKAEKLLPYTKGLLADFSRATSPWIASLFVTHPALFTRRSYWSVSPAARAKETTEGGIPIGMADDTEYFGPLVRFGMRRLAAVPGTVARIRDMDEWRETTLLHLLRARDLGVISVWSPTFLTLLVDHLEANLARLVLDLPGARRDEIERASARGFSPTRIWPKLKVISTWTDGPSGTFVDGLRARFPGVEIQPKGLLATEGVVSFPLAGIGNVLALTSHFLEFLDLDRPHAPPRLAQELQLGASYSPILTTSGGLTRYHLKDIVTVTGYYRRAPLLRFEGKLDRVSDLAGEKVHEAQVRAALDRASKAVGTNPKFALLAPALLPSPRYRLYLEGVPNDLVAPFGRSVEAHLGHGHHYRYCRDLGQLGPVEVVEVSRGFERYERALVSRGLRCGDVKPSALDARTFWNEVFSSSHFDR